MRVAALEATVPPEKVLEHTHKEAHLILVTSGHYVSSARDMPAVSRNPLALFNPPGTTHRDRFAQAGGHFLSVTIPAAVWLGMENKAQTSRIAHRLGTRAMILAYQVRSELTRWDFASSLEHETCCHSLLEEILNSNPLSARRPAWLGSVCDRLRQANSGPPSLNELALDANVHPVYLGRAFRRHIGCSPGVYLRRARLEYAVGLMSNGASLSEAAHGAGFYDQSHFNRVVRSTANMTPTALRKLLYTIE